jgi:hypothetical protein
MIFNIFDKMKKGSVYAVQTGDYVGQFFNYVGRDGNNYFFLSTPTVEIVKVPKEKFDFALDNGIIEYVETLPRNIFKVIKAQYQQLSETNGKNTF